MEQFDRCSYYRFTQRTVLEFVRCSDVLPFAFRHVLFFSVVLDLRNSVLSVKDSLLMTFKPVWLILTNAPF